MHSISNIAIRNTHLHERHFIAALLAAATLHLLLLFVWMMAPQPPVTQIPVRVLNIKLGGQQDEIELAAPPVPEAVDPGLTNYLAAQPSPVPANPEAVAKALNKGMQMLETPAAPVQQPKAETAQPHRYVRHHERHAATKPQPKQQATGTPLGNSQSSQAEMFLRYGQLISSWLKKFEHPPVVSSKQTVIVRIQLDRKGNVHHLSVDQSSGSQALDTAAMQTVLIANPLPPVPADYQPTQSLFEYKIPFIFYPQ